jgi:hypothetical protein
MMASTKLFEVETTQHTTRTENCKLSRLCKILIEQPLSTRLRMLWSEHRKQFAGTVVSWFDESL